ncbi:ATP-binding protein [Parachryseolinea silvisoli]|uniref:ATP-binding protein n=1 Tax=Parachryseolinea silvisoli TaxID=2873601 RepID=UPI00226591B1|nr:ATP-binding protein [Parachryseolinea silvisoli]MCD9014146.1 PAS domain-containing protein [Parachryseolinea silvisoli]
MDSPTPAKLNVTPEFLAGGGEMGQRIREYNWANTPLGPVESWPQNLRTCVRIMLTSRQPIWIGWGKELIKLYNDPYKDIVRGKHPWALGVPASEVWRDIWKDIGPMLRQVMEEDEGTYVECQLLIMERNGYPEETYYTFSYTPIPGDQGGTAGMICANTDDTERIIGERQLATLTLLAKNLADCGSAAEVISNSIKTFEQNPHDFPFALFRTVSNDSATLAGSTNLGEAASLVQAEVDLRADHDIANTLRHALGTRQLQLFEGVTQKVGSLPRGAWAVSPEKLIVLPIAQPAAQVPYGLLIVGLNPYRLLDEKYRGFFMLVADQIASSFANVHSLIQERKRAEALAELDRAKTTFFANISHEFRTPLTLLLAPVEDALGDPNLDPENKARMDVAYRNALRMQKLVNTLLEFSRIEAGRVEGKFRLVDIAALTTDLASTFRSAVERAGMQLNVVCRPVTDPVYVDPDMWERIVLNLVSNAFKYSKQGDITVSVGQRGDAVEVSVADTGIGIPAGQLDKIFSRFHRVDNPGGRSEEGSGIGLAMVKELVKLHFGKITVTSVPGEGSVFTVSIPVGTGHLNSEQIEASSNPGDLFKHSTAFVEEALKWLPAESSRERQPNHRSGTQEDRSKVLLADDNADMRGYLARLLSEQFEVITAADGEDALRKVLEFRPDLVLSDIMMPRLDGFGLLKKVRSHPEVKNTPLIFLSARAGEEAKVEGLDAGADDYLVKPFSARELMVRVSNHIRINQVRRETELQFYRLFLEAPAIINVFRGKDFRYELFHPKNKEIFGDVDFTGMALLDALPELKDQPIMQQLNEVYNEGRTIYENERHVTFAGHGGPPRECYFNYIYQPWYDLKGNIQGVLNFAIDVTEQVRTRKMIEDSERQFRLVLTGSPSIFLFLQGREMRITFVNEPLLASWGKTDEIVGKTLLEVLPEMAGQPFPRLLDEVFTTGNAYHGKEEKAVIYKDGVAHEVYYNYLYQPIQEPNGPVTGVNVMATDITAQVIARREIEDSERKYRALSEHLEAIVEERTVELRRSNDDLQQFAHVASHDLKEPVRKMTTFINRLDDEYGESLPESGKIYLDKMRRASTRMYDMIDGVLKYSSVNEGGQEIESVDLNDIITSIEADLELLFQRKHAVLEKGNLPVIDGARILVYQLFYNLINNALKFSKSEPRIVVSAKVNGSAATPTAEVTVQDNGIGFSQVYAEKIFDAFSRLHPKDRYEGTGLGLALCKKIVERHHGTIRGTSEENKGSAFIVTLPIKQRNTIL